VSDKTIGVIKIFAGCCAALGGAYMVGNGAMLIVAGTVFMITGAITILRCEIKSIRSHENI